jgi:hypothetical protein
VNNGRRSRGRWIGKGRDRRFVSSHTGESMNGDRNSQRGTSVAGSTYDDRGSSFGGNRNYHGQGAYHNGQSSFGGNHSFPDHGTYDSYPNFGNSGGYSNYGDRGGRSGRGGHYGSYPGYDGYDYHMPRVRDQNPVTATLQHIVGTMNSYEERVDFALAMVDPTWRPDAQFRSPDSRGPSGGVGWARSGQDSGPKRVRLDNQNQNARQRDIFTGRRQNLGGRGNHSQSYVNSVGPNRELPPTSGSGSRTVPRGNEVPPVPPPHEPNVSGSAAETANPAGSGGGGEEMDTRE